MRESNGRNQERGSTGVIELVPSKTGMILDEAMKLFPEFITKRGKYKVAAHIILEKTEDLDPKQVYPCELVNGDSAKALGLVHFTNDYLKENNSDWRLKFSPVSGKYALYNLELLGRKSK